MPADLGTSLLLVTLGAAVGAGVAAMLLIGRARSARALALAEAAATQATLAATAARVPGLEERIAAQEAERTALVARLAEASTRLEQERAQAQAQLATLTAARTELSEAFQALSAQSLRENNRSFLELATATLERFQQAAQGDLTARGKAVETLVQPIQESLAKVATSVAELERQRVSAFASLGEQVKGLLAGQERLTSETLRLSTALRAPNVGGRWGEIQLERVVELAGMLEHCDFTRQQGISGEVDEETARLRPDVIVHLPGGSRVVVDAKAPLTSYLAALEAKDEETRRGHLRDHARRVRGHLQALSAKSYWQHLQAEGGSPEFVVLFLPGETFFSAAAQEDPTLIEFGVEHHVILATPTTLIALLRAVAYGWRQEQLARNAEAIAEHGRNLYNRMRILSEHLAEVGEALGRSVKIYNKAIGALESGVLPAARRFRDLGAATGAEIGEILPIEHGVRALRTEDSHAREAGPA